MVVFKASLNNISTALCQLIKYSLIRLYINSYVSLLDISNNLGEVNETRLFIDEDILLMTELNKSEIFFGSRIVDVYIEVNIVIFVFFI